MKKPTLYVALCWALVAIGCSSPSSNIVNLRLGMVPVEVTDAMGEPTTIRSAKVYEDGQTTETWEYRSRFFEINPKTFWIHFENRRVVQWGEPGDYAGKSGKSVPVDEYKPFKALK